MSTLSRRSLLAAAAISPALALQSRSAAAAPAESAPTDQKVHYKTQQVGDVEIFYREAGATNAPVLLLLHGFPTSGHMFRDLIPLLAQKYRVIAPDLPGFGETKTPARGQFQFSFDNIAKVIGGFVDALGLKRYAIYIFDYGAPTGLRLALAHPDRITAIISQNGNAYEEGLSEGWNPIQRYWKDPSDTNRDALRDFLKPDSVRWQYTQGAQDATLVSTDGSNLDSFFLARPGRDEIQLDLFLDYRSNVALYPQFQAYFREHQPPLLAAWGNKDPFFIPPGAQAYKRDLPKAEITFFDAGHFALETHHTELGALIIDFLGRNAVR